ncbi:MAG TPA: tripartite tricarboxylate transporter substrate binding protein [Burkholderiales bacterium]|nr:tripartite tricarboxylate transporter substrate binding protein [Burkholderiales bacterium]
MNASIIRLYTCVCVTAAVLAITTSPAIAAQASPDYSTRPIRLLVPFAPGGGADTLARIVTPKLAESMGRQWVVDNRGGAAGNIAAETVARAAPDGHTVFMGFSTVLTVNPSLYKLGFNMENDLQPVTLLATAQYILVVHPSVQASTVKELVTLMRERPKSLNYASAGVGSPLHLAGELFQRRAGVSMVHLPYKGGGPAAAAVLGGEAQLIFGSVASSMPHVKAGKLKALATTGSRRSKVAPDVPTMSEAGVPGVEVTSWYAVMVPAGTPEALVRRMRDNAVKALAAHDVQQAMARQGLEPETSTAPELAARIRAETKTWAEVIKAAGIKGE